jgi:hypothetical protein
MGLNEIRMPSLKDKLVQREVLKKEVEKVDEAIEKMVGDKQVKIKRKLKK